MGTLGGAAGRVRAVQWVGWTVCKRRGLGRGGSGAAHTTLVVHQVPLRHIWHLHKWERSNRRMRYKLTGVSGHAQHVVWARRRAGAGRVRAQPAPLGTTMHYPALRRHYDSGAG